MLLVVITIPTEKEFREGTSEWLNSQGFRVENVSEDGNEERADMLVFDDSVHLLLELKIKGENEVEAAERDSVLQHGGVHRHSESSLRRNRMSALIAKGVSQLTNTPIERDFNILWLHGAGRYADQHGTRFIASLYGRRWLIPIPGQDGRYCYYFDNSDFFLIGQSLALLLFPGVMKDFFASMISIRPLIAFANLLFVRCLASRASIHLRQRQPVKHT